MRISDWSSDVCSSDLLGAAAAELTRLSRHLGGDGEYRVVRRPAAIHLAVARQGQAPGLRPLLQLRLRIGGGLAVRLDARRPGSGDELLGRRQAAVEVERADYRFADVGNKARDRQRTRPYSSHSC